MNGELTMTDSGVRRRILSGWRRFLDYTFHVRRHDGSTDKTAMAWRAFQTALGLTLLGLGTTILNHVNGTYSDNGYQRIEKRLSDLEDKVDILSRQVHYVTRFVDGFEDLKPNNNKVNK